MKPSIVTSFVYPPIPVRQFDWMACRDGCEEDGIYGYGRTERDAIDDLLAIEADAESEIHAGPSGNFIDREWREVE